MLFLFNLITLPSFPSFLPLPILASVSPLRVQKYKTIYVNNNIYYIIITV